MDIGLTSGSHACHFFETFDDQMELLGSFFREGLIRGEHCLFITPGEFDLEWLGHLGSLGSDFREALNTGALTVVPGAAFRVGEFNTVRKARELWLTIEDSLRGSTGVRIAGDAAWALNPTLPEDQLCHWEAAVNLVYEGASVRAICQYRLDEHSPAAIHGAFRTHPVVIYDGVSHANPFYEAPEILKHEPYFNHSEANSEMVADLLARLKTK